MMNRYITIIAVIWLSCVQVLAETITFKDGIHIHWMSGNDKIISPDQTWELDIVPNVDGDSSPVYLRKPGQDKTHLLFEFGRDGMIFWKGDALFVEDRASSSTYSIMLFNPLSNYPHQRQGLVLDEIVRAEVRRKVKNEEIYHYYPHFVSWTGNELVVAVATGTVKYGTGQSGMSPCLGYEIDAQSLEIKASLTDKELLEKYNLDCEKGW